MKHSKFMTFDELMEVLESLSHKTVSTKVSRKAITYSVAIGGEKIDFRVSRKLAQIHNEAELNKNANQIRND